MSSVFGNVCTQVVELIDSLNDPKNEYEQTAS